MGWFKSIRKNAFTMLAADIVSTADGCCREIIFQLKPRTGELSNETRYRLLCEFLYLFLHITSRLAFTLLGRERTTQLIPPLGPLVANTYIEAFLGHWPTDVKEKIEAEFLENLNVAEAEYASCKALNIEGKMFSRDAVVGKASFDIAEIAGNPNDVADLMFIIGVIGNALLKLNLRQRIEEAAREEV